jgi:hypothetical protein
LLLAVLDQRVRWSALVSQGSWSTSSLSNFVWPFPFWQSFINVSLISICFAGLMINFIAAFILSLMKKWLANGQVTFIIFFYSYFFPLFFSIIIWFLLLLFSIIF